MSRRTARTARLAVSALAAAGLVASSLVGSVTGTAGASSHRPGLSADDAWYTLVQNQQLRGWQFIENGGGDVRLTEAKSGTVGQPGTGQDTPGALAMDISAPGAPGSTWAYGEDATLIKRDFETEPRDLSFLRYDVKGGASLRLGLTRPDVDVTGPDSPALFPQGAVVAVYLPQHTSLAQAPFVDNGFRRHTPSDPQLRSWQDYSPDPAYVSPCKLDNSDGDLCTLPEILGRHPDRNLTSFSFGRGSDLPSSTPFDAAVDNFVYKYTANPPADTSQNPDYDRNSQRSDYKAFNFEERYYGPIADVPPPPPTEPLGRIRVLNDEAFVTMLGAYEYGTLSGSTTPADGFVGYLTHPDGVSPISEQRVNFFRIDPVLGNMFLCQGVTDVSGMATCEYTDAALDPTLLDVRVQARWVGPAYGPGEFPQFTPGPFVFHGIPVPVAYGKI